MELSLSLCHGAPSKTRQRQRTCARDARTTLLADAAAALCSPAIELVPVGSGTPKRA